MISRGSYIPPSTEIVAGGPNIGHPLSAPFRGDIVSVHCRSLRAPLGLRSLTVTPRFAWESEG